MLITEYKNIFNYGKKEPGMLRIILLILIGFFLGIILISNSLSIARINWLIHWSFSSVIPFGIFEEVIFRGLLWKFLKKQNWSDFWIVIFQVILFWFAHGDRIFTYPVDFWIIIPLGSILFSLIAWRSRSITPSSIAHILLNVLFAYI